MRLLIGVLFLLGLCLPQKTCAQQKPLWLGEELRYRIHWGFLPAGYATLSSTQTAILQTRPAYAIASSARSTGLVDALYRVRDQNLSWMDAEHLYSLGYQKKLREGSFFRDETVFFDYERLQFFATSLNKKGEVHHSSGPISGFVYDPLSSLYAVRLKELKVGREYVLDVNTKKNWPLRIKVLRTETIEVPAGRFECFVVEPFLREEGIFIPKGKQMQVWITQDSERIPVYVRTEVFIGHVHAELLERSKRN
ncbi:MAG: DUF3108 domain-containing protein [Elusimicrobia bacterium]|nr:DUF3108 domain-containing protein [Elusimicrobiota bacterium]